MSWRTSKTRGGRTALAVLGIMGALLTTAGGDARAESSAAASELGVVGAWAVQVTLRDCATNAPLGTFNSLVSYQRGGTLSESNASLAFAPGQRTAGHGSWGRKGAQTFRQRMISLIAFDSDPNLPGSPTFDPSLPISPGFFAGWSIVTQTVELDGPDHFSSTGTNSFHKATGEVYRTGCSTAVGQRFK